MKASERYRVAGATLLAVAVAEGARRLLSPRTRPIEPAPVRPARLLQRRPRSSAEPATRGPNGRSGWRGRRSIWRAISYLVLRPPAWLRRRAAARRRGRGRRGAARHRACPADAPAQRGLSAAGDGRRPRHPVLGRLGRDLAKAGAISAGFAGGAGAAVVAATRRWPRTWWAAGRGRLGGASEPCWPRSRRSCWPRSSTTSRRCPRARRATTCSSSRRRRGSRWGRCTRSTPAAERPPPTPT